MNNRKVIIAGGTGFIGQAMAERWSANNEIIILSRMKPAAANNSYSSSLNKGVKYVQWDGKTLGNWSDVLEASDLLINLAGRSVNCRYNLQNREEILNSRVNATAILGTAVKQCARPPKLWINGASATIYPHATTTPRDESFTDFTDDFSVQVCKSWESIFNQIHLEETRKVVLRMAIVLGEGGVMVPYKTLAKLGLGGQQGNGRQMFSWLHIDDLCSMVEWLWKNDGSVGVYNASSPDPVTNYQFMKDIRMAMKIPFGLPAPAWMLKIGAALIGTETELLIKSRWVLPTRFLKEGFAFQYPNLKHAFNNLLIKA